MSWMKASRARFAPLGILWDFISARFIPLQMELAQQLQRDCVNTTTCQKGKKCYGPPSPERLNDEHMAKAMIVCLPGDTKTRLLTRAEPDTSSNVVEFVACSEGACVAAQPRWQNDACCTRCPLPAARGSMQHSTVVFTSHHITSHCITLHHIASHYITYTHHITSHTYITYITCITYITYIRTYIHHIHTLHTYLRTYIHYIHTHIHTLHTYIHTYIHTYTHTYITYITYMHTLHTLHTLHT